MQKFISDLKVETTKKEFTFTTFHELKVKVISEVFSDLVDVEENLDDILVLIKNLKTNNYQITSSQKEMLTNYSKNKFNYSSKKGELYFNEEVSSKLKEFRGRVYNTIREIESIESIISSSELYKDRMEQMIKETEGNIMRVFNEIPELKENIKKVLKDSLKNEY